jgi:hypothetical protein
MRKKLALLMGKMVIMGSPSKNKELQPFEVASFIANKTV